MPDFQCKVNDIGSANNCSDKAGLLIVYTTLDSSVNWAAMNSPVNYDTATNTVLNWIMNTGQYWAKFLFNRKTGRLDATYTVDNGYYDVQLLNLLFKGKQATRTMSIGQLAACCNLIFQVHDNNSLSRVIGKEHIAGEWVNPLSKGALTRHLDTTGQFGNNDDKNRDETDFGANHSHPIPYSTVGINAMDLITASNAVATKVLGRSATEILGRSATEILGNN